MADYLVNLYDMDPSRSPEKLEEAGITIRRVLSPDKGKVMEFVRKYYEGGWESECEHAFSHDPITCYIAVQKGEIIGFSCFDATAKGYFGPIGIRPDEKGHGTGQALLRAALLGMREAGYGYAVIGWAEHAEGFYRKSLKKVFEIPDSQAENTIYRTLTIF